MGMTSAAEEKLNARIRPDITAMRSRTPYPKRRLSVVPPVDGEPAAATPGAGVGASPSQVTPASRQVTAMSMPVNAVSSPAARPAEAPSAEQAPAGRPREVPSRRSAPEGPIRLTRRGRIVVGTLVVIAVVVAASVIWLLVAGQAVASDHVQSGHVASQTLRKVVVRPGQTLWGIAVAVDPAADPRAVVQEIIDENELSGTTIQAGQVLWVPRG